MPGQKQTTSAQLPLRTPSLSEVEKQPLGKAAIEKLSAAGSDPTSLEISVGFVVLTRMIPVMRIPDLKGFSRKSLSRIPQELRSTATILERIRDNPFYNAALEKSVPG
ncbi:MAG TPA: hypothetical protein VNK23_00910, partial [Candidatus Dormibacteraeota bacterium]|nr:hypothetical protein [Candidatus Dormibacteraeota bacterium]